MEIHLITRGTIIVTAFINKQTAEKFVKDSNEILGLQTITVQDAQGFPVKG